MSVCILKGREGQLYVKGGKTFDIVCDRPSLAGSVSQRACTFCGSRVVLYPIKDVLHVVHGPVGCASYTWDIRGALSSDVELHRYSFSTDLKESEVIHGGEKKLYRVLCELIDRFHPRAAFVYATCIVGVIGDDVDAVCRKVEREKGIPVYPVHSEGFKGTKKDGYRAACDVLFRIVSSGGKRPTLPCSINIIGEFNIAGETWLIRRYYEEMGVRVVSTITGDSSIEEIAQAGSAALNVVQCSGSTTLLAKMMEERYAIPFIRVSYFGVEDTAEALYQVARFFEPSAPGMLTRTRELVASKVSEVYAELERYRRDLEGSRAAIYVGGAFKAFSLIKALRLLGISTPVVGSQTGSREDYETIAGICEEGTVILDDSNPAELAHFLKEKDVHLLIGGVKERPLSYKLGVAFCDHNHERKLPLAGFEGMVNFAREVHASLMSPVWRFFREGVDHGSVL